MISANLGIVYVKHVANTTEHIVVHHITALFLLFRVDVREYRKKNKRLLSRLAGSIV